MEAASRKDEGGDEPPALIIVLQITETGVSFSYLLVWREATISPLTSSTWCEGVTIYLTSSVSREAVFSNINLYNCK